MPELLYLSRAKLQRWLPESGGIADRIGGELGGGAIPGKVTIARAPDRTGDVPLSERLQRAVKDIESSSRIFAVTDSDADNGDWFEFEGIMRYGKVRRNIPFAIDGTVSAAQREQAEKTSTNPSESMVFFVGSFPDPSPVVDVMLGGWIGHLLDESAVQGPGASRMGSRTEHLYDLWTELSEAEQAGTFEIPDVWRRLPHETSTGLTLEELCFGAYGMLAVHLPEATAVRLKGWAQILARLDGRGRPLPLILGTPLYVEYSAAPESPTALPESEHVAPSASKPHWWRRLSGR